MGLVAAMENLQIRFARPVVGELTPGHFEATRAPWPSPGEGQVLVRNVYLSLDPYQRRQMMPGVAYAEPLRTGDVMVGRTIARVVASRHPGFAPGDWVRGSIGWQTCAALDAHRLERLALDGFSPTAYLGALGSPGLTAWVGLRAIGQAAPGETVLVSAVTGSVGSVAAALASATGCRVVGVAGGGAKCEHAVRFLHCDTCLDHRAPDFGEQLVQATPQGIDVDFENVGGRVFDLVLPRLNDFARVALCGLVSQYNLQEPYGMRHIAELLNRNVMLQGFRVAHYQRHRDEAFGEIKELLRHGWLRQDECIVDGLENAPQACIDMLAGRHVGKPLVRIGPESDD